MCNKPALPHRNATGRSTSNDVTAATQLTMRSSSLIKTCHVERRSRSDRSRNTCGCFSKGSTPRLIAKLESLVMLSGAKRSRNTCGCFWNSLFFQKETHRCEQPGQQHGRRIPSFSSEHTRSTCCRLVSSRLTEIVQQIHSFRASGVMSSHAASAFSSDASAFRRSAGSS